MNRLFVLKNLATIACLASVASTALAQNSVKVFDPVVVQPSAPGTGYGTSQVVFDSRDRVALMHHTSDHRHAVFNHRRHRQPSRRQLP